MFLCFSFLSSSSISCGPVAPCAYVCLYVCVYLHLYTTHDTFLTPRLTFKQLKTPPQTTHNHFHTLHSNIMRLEVGSHLMCSCPTEATQRVPTLRPPSPSNRRRSSISQCLRCSKRTNKWSPTMRSSRRTPARTPTTMRPAVKPPWSWKTTHQKRCDHKQRRSF